MENENNIIVNGESYSIHEIMDGAYDEDMDNALEISSGEIEFVDRDQSISIDADETTDPLEISNTDSESIENDDNEPIEGLMNNALENEDTLIGRRIVDVDAFFHQLKELAGHSESDDCGLEDMVITKEIKKGLFSKFKVICTKCGSLRIVESCPRNDTSLGVNEAAVAGITSVGLGLYQLEELCSHLGIPCMSNRIFDKLNKDQQDAWFALAETLALEALHEEIDLAIAQGDVDEMGNALVAAELDGSYNKRSYGKNLSSLAGCAVIIGLRTQKIIYFGIKNKYCHVCAIAESKKVTVRDHICNKNYVGPSSGMETAIIIDGFKECEKNGARFFKYVGDGDSSTHRAIQDLRLYREPSLLPEKLECVNHLCRNFCKRFADLSKATKKFKIASRRLITLEIGLNIAKGVRLAAKHWREANVPFVDKIQNLESDVMNAPSHYFGVHTNCNEYFCKKNTEEAAVENLNLLKSDGLYFEVLSLCQEYFANNAKSLLENVTTNRSESFNNIIAKYTGGKRINYSLAASYKGRVSAAVVHHNTNGKAGSSFHQFKLGDVVQPLLERIETNRKRKCAINSAEKEIKPKVRRVQAEPSQKYYGIECEKPDMEPRAFEIAKERLINELKKNQSNDDAIEKATIGKKTNPRWFEIRQNLIPCTYFHRIVNATNKKSFTNILNEFLYKKTEFGNSAEIKHQRIQEREALPVFKSLYKESSLVDCGLYIDRELYYLCASPFKTYGEDHIVSIKCPKSAFNMNIDEAIQSGKIPLWKKESKGSNRMIINTKSSWFIELQGQMHICRRSKAHLMIWLGPGSTQYKTVEIPRVDNFWDEEMKEKLTFFYDELMIKELVDPRVARHMDIRVYDAEKETFL